MPLFRIEKSVATLPDADAYVSVTKFSMRLIYMALNLSWRRNQMVLLALGIVNVMLHVPKNIQFAHFAKQQTTLRTAMLMGFWGRLSRRYLPFGPSCNHSAEKRSKKENISYKVTVVALQCKRKER